MRPPRLRNSSVSIANHIFSSRRASATRSATSEALAPSDTAFAAARAIRPRPPNDRATPDVKSVWRNRSALCLQSRSVPSTLSSP